MSTEPAFPFPPAQSGVFAFPGTNRNAQPWHVGAPLDDDAELDEIDELPVVEDVALDELDAMAPPMPPPPSWGGVKRLPVSPPHAENGIVSTIAQNSQTEAFFTFSPECATAFSSSPPRATRPAA